MNQSLAMSTQLLHLFLLSGILTGVIAASGNTTTTTTFRCPAAYQCGHDVDIRYPFWVGAGGANNAPHCGYPALRLECRHDRPVLPLPSGGYVVERIMYGERTVAVFDIGVLETSTSSTCPLVAARSITLQPPLSLTARDANLTFFVNCSFVGAARAHIISCLQNGANNTYVFRDGRVPDGAAKLCQDIIVMPVLKLDPMDGAAKLCQDIVVMPVLKLNPMDDDIVTMLNGGFELSWSPAESGDCADCEKTGGFCGADEVFRCFTMSPAASKHSMSTGLKVGITFIVLAVAAGGVGMIVLVCRWLKQKRQEGSGEISMGSMFSFRVPEINPR